MSAGRQRHLPDALDIGCLFALNIRFPRVFFAMIGGRREVRVDILEGQGNGGHQCL